MKVRFVTSLERGGPIEHTLALARALARIGVDVGVTCGAESVSERFRASGIDAATAPLRSARDQAGARRVWRLVGDADVVHAQDRRSGLWVRLYPRPARRKGIRAYTVHGLPDEYLPAPVGPASPGVRGLLAYRLLDARLCLRAELVIVASHALERILVDRLGFPAARMAVVPGGVEAACVDESQQGELVGTVTTIEPVKGLDVFLRAVSRLASTRPDLGFAIFGAGSDLERLRSLSFDLGIADRVSFPGYVPSDQALSELRVFALTSWMENCPTALLEAMAAGVPAVATAVGGVPELAGDAVALVEAGDDEGLAGEIARLLDDGDLAQSRAHAGQARVREHFSIERVARETLTAYERSLAGR